VVQVRLSVAFATSMGIVWSASREALRPSVHHVAVPELPGEIVKTMPPRGPLQQYRLTSAVPFTCHRCGGQKTSKLLTVVDDDQERLLCNGCYGRLNALWDLKAGDLPDNQRDEAILALLDAMVTPEQIEAAQTRLVVLSRHCELSPPAQRVLATAEAVTHTLRRATGLDWSAAVIGLCKAVEIEVARRLMEPLREVTKDLDLSVDLADKDLSRVAKYCTGRAPSPELGSLAYTLTVAVNSRRRVKTSPLLRALLRLSQDWTGGEWILAPDGLSDAANTLSKQYRNPAAHTTVLNEKDFEDCHRLVQGEDGLLARLVRATLPRP
jgi:hypothetical protein